MAGVLESAVFCSHATSLSELHLPVVTEVMHRYSLIRYSLFFFSIFYSLFSVWIILQTRISAKLRDFAIRVHRNIVIQVAVYAGGLTLTLTLLSLPLSLLSGFYIEHQFGFSNQTLAAYLIDKLKGLVTSSIINTLLLEIFFAAVNRFRKHWPLVLWLVAVPLLALGIFAEPLVFDPIFNKFTPMQDSPLKTKIVELATRAGIPNATILVVDRSKQTNKTNAYVSGIGDTSRIVLWDSTINKLPEDEVLAVVGHEVGHYVLHHILFGFVFALLGLLLWVPLAYLYANKFVAILPKSWQIGGINDYAIAPALTGLMLIAGFLSMPLINYYSRFEEHQADQFGLQITGNRLAMANLFIDFSEGNLSEPNPPPIVKFFLFTHPTLKERIEFAAGRKVD